MIFAGKTTASKDRISTNALRDQNRNKCEVFFAKILAKTFSKRNEDTPDGGRQRRRHRVLDVVD